MVDGEPLGDSHNATLLIGVKTFDSCGLPPEALDANFALVFFSSVRRITHLDTATQIPQVKGIGKSPDSTKLFVSRGKKISSARITELLGFALSA